MKLWLDDIRPMPVNFDVHVRNAKDAISLINVGIVDYISFDHDLGEGLSGNAVAKMIEFGYSFNFIDKYIAWDIHSKNPVGSKNIFDTMTSADKIWMKRF